jgi:hypothetical protein
MPATTLLAASMLVNIILLVLLQLVWWDPQRSRTAELARILCKNIQSTATAPEVNVIEAHAVDAPVASDSAGPSSGGVHPDHIPVFSAPIGTVAHGGGASLSFVEQLWPLRQGRAFVNSSHETAIRPVLAIPSDARRICIDVGTYLHSPTSKLWWSRDPNTFVVAFEPNKFSVAMMTRLAHPIMMSQMTGYWPFCSARSGRNLKLEQELDLVAAGRRLTGEEAAMVANSSEESGSVSSATVDLKNSSGDSKQSDGDGSRQAVTYSMMQDCMSNMWGHITRHSDRFLVVPAALSAQDYFTTFQVGLKNRADMGSLLNFKKSIKKKKGLAHESEERIFASVAKLSHVLQLLPSHSSDNGPSGGSPMMWDTLKIDAQGVDSLIIAGAGPLLSHFVCIVGEFDTRAYDANQVFRYRQYLKDMLFVRAGHTVFVNLRYAQLFLKKMVICKAPDLKTRWHRMATVVREALKISRRAGGLKVLINQSS